jgi:hypothetical protein
MKASAVTLVLLFAIVPTLAQKSISSKTLSGECPVPAHAHRYSDVRIADIEVNKVDSCGFSFADLEDNSVGVDNFLQFSNEFCITRTESNKQQSTQYRTIKMPKKDLKEGMRGAAIYCAYCKAVFTLRLDSRNKGIAMR